MFKYTTAILKIVRTFVLSRRHLSSNIRHRMEGGDNILDMEAILQREARAIVPKLTQDMYKGQAGRIGIIGGSFEYTGAPYFAAISALKVGCDLSHIFCPLNASQVIKSYSPELIVHPVLDSENALDLIKPWLPRLHVLVIGPGLGRDAKILDTVASIITFCRDNTDYMKPLVIDADGLHMITEKPTLIQNYPTGVILTPNAIEFTRLFKVVLNRSLQATPFPEPDDVRALATALGTNIVVLHKGAADVIASGCGSAVVRCRNAGSGRRCGGQGDLLSGSLGTFFCWANLKTSRDPSNVDNMFTPAMVAAYASCCLTRECNRKAFAKAGRSTLTTDMIQEIHPSFSSLFGE